ncbi:phage tail tube protein [Candidatus Avoscillospira sp. LCP25S3_F1]|uniref:phage tail tube protein n=1 Tax=Candidatus Avoscillospira sp. LCP25S3_F1 TaxID=3438825 RepID=UPI003F8E8CCD
MSIAANRVMSGTWGQVWVASELWAEVSAFQAKFTYTKEDQQMAGQMAVDTKIVNAKGTGSITIKKVFSRTANHSNQVLKGIDERLTIVGKLADPDAYGAERVAFYNVSLDEEAIMDWKAGGTTEITIPFTFTDREWLQEVQPT